MRCPYYTDGYCFWFGDIGCVCDYLQWGTLKKIKDGYCPKEESKKELKLMAEAMMEEKYGDETD